MVGVPGDEGNTDITGGGRSSGTWDNGLGMTGISSVMICLRIVTKRKNKRNPREDTGPKITNN